MKTLKIATRQSPLALWQAEHIRARLEALHAGLTVELVTFCYPRGQNFRYTIGKKLVAKVYLSKI